MRCPDGWPLMWRLFPPLPRRPRLIRKEVSKVMRELAGYHYDPKKYEERVRERRDWSERDSDDE